MDSSAFEGQERFWTRVRKTETCWLWTGYIKPNGYGSLSSGRRGGHTYAVYAHRRAWELAFGPIPSGMDVCHACDTRACVRPGHLLLGSRAANLQDAARKGRLARGERNGSAVLTAEAVQDILARAGQGRSQSQLAAQFGVAQATIARVLTGESWKHIPGIRAQRRSHAEAAATLTPAQVQQIRAQRGTALQKHIAAQFGISRSMVSMIHTGKCWAHLPWESVAVEDLGDE